MKGWSEDIRSARRFKDLPLRAREYVQMIEAATDTPVKWIGVGPEREATIRR
jgi:adenylosuccinate synthase